MKINNINAIGNHFKKENVYLCTFIGGEVNIPDYFSKVIPSDLLDCFVNNSIITSENYDIFYLDENGFTRFVEEGTETFKGDNSDGKGNFINIVSAWDYFKDDELFEADVNGFKMIVADNVEPLDRYNEDYNLKQKDRRR